MGTIADKLAYTKQAREEIRTAIVAKGVVCPGTAPFCTFDDYIEQISGGGGGGGASCTYDMHVSVDNENTYTLVFYLAVFKNSARQFTVSIDGEDVANVNVDVSAGISDTVSFNVITPITAGTKCVTIKSQDNTAFAPISLNVCEALAYKYFRIYVTKAMRGGSDAAFTNFSEIKFYDVDGVEFTTDSATYTCSSTYGTDEAYKAFDGTINSFWHSGTDGMPQWICAQYKTAHSLGKVRLYTRSDSFQDWPADFQIQASNDGSTWEVLKEYSSQEYWGVGEFKDFNIASVSYTHYYTLSTAAPPIYQYAQDDLLLMLDATYNCFDKYGHATSQETATWYDKSFSGHDGKINNATWNDNKLSFNGSSSWVNCGQLNTSYLTLEVFVKFNSITQSGEGNNVATNAQSGGYGICNENGKYTGFVNVGGSYHNVYSSDVDTSQFVHLALTYDGNFLRLYQNGVEVDSKATTGVIKVPDSNTVFILGADPTGSTASGGYLNGDICTVRVYSRALTDEEILNNYNLDKDRYNA